MCVGVIVCKPSPPVTCGHMVQSWPILGRQREEESRSKEGRRCAVLHPILAADKCLFTFTDLAHQAHLGTAALCIALYE